MKTIFDGKIEFNTNQDIETLVNQMDRNISLTILESAINYALKMGIYDLDECFVIYNCFLKLKKDETDSVSSVNNIDSPDKNH